MMFTKEASLPKVTVVLYTSGDWTKVKTNVAMVRSHVQQLYGIKAGRAVRSASGAATRQSDEHNHVKESRSHAAFKLSFG